jgi:hypothetical protein
MKKKEELTKNVLFSMIDIERKNMSKTELLNELQQALLDYKDCCVFESVTIKGLIAGEEKFCVAPL